MTYKNKSQILDMMLLYAADTGRGILTDRYINNFTLEEKGMVQELVDDEKIKRVTIEFGHLPNMKFLCLTDVYCVEVDESNGESWANEYLNKFLGLPQTASAFKFREGMTEEVAISVWEEIHKDYYEKWLIKNKEDLSVLKEMHDAIK